MNKPLVIEKFADNGEHSHWEVIDTEGNVLWQESDEHQTPTVSAEEVLDRHLATDAHGNTIWIKHKVVDAMNSFAKEFRTPAPEGEKIFDKNGDQVKDGDNLIYIGTNMSGVEVRTINGRLIVIGQFNCGYLSEWMAAKDFESIEIDKKNYDCIAPTTPAPADSLAATADEIKEGLQNSFFKETGGYYFNNLKVWSNWLENKIVEYRQYVGVQVGGVEELALSKYCTPYGKPDPCTYAFIDGYNTGYQHKPANDEGEEDTPNNIHDWITIKEPIQYLERIMNGEKPDKTYLSHLIKKYKEIL